MNDEDKPVVELDDWSVILEFDSPKLMGKVKGHPKIEDGKVIVTSLLVMLNAPDKIAETQNTFYKLLEPNVEFMKYVKDNGYSLADYKSVTFN